MRWAFGERGGKQTEHNSVLHRERELSVSGQLSFMMTLFFMPDNGPIRMNLLIGLREKLVEGFRFFRRCGIFDAQDHHVIPIDIATDGGGFATDGVCYSAGPASSAPALLFLRERDHEP